MWILRYASNDIGAFQSVEGAKSYLAKKYGAECVNIEEFIPMVRVGKKAIPMSNRGKCYSLSCKHEEMGFNRTTIYELEQIQNLD